MSVSAIPIIPPTPIMGYEIVSHVIQLPFLKELKDQNLITQPIGRFKAQSKASLPFTKDRLHWKRRSIHQPFNIQDNFISSTPLKETEGSHRVIPRSDYTLLQSTPPHGKQITPEKQTHGALSKPGCFNPRPRVGTTHTPPSPNKA